MDAMDLWCYHYNYWCYYGIAVLGDLFLVKMRSIKALIFPYFFIIFFIFVFTSSGSGKPIVGEIYSSPSNPLPLSTVTFTAGIYNNSSGIEAVQLIAQEYMDDLCFIDSQNISMNYTYSCCMDFYEIELELTHEDATQIKYHLEILSNGTWYEYETNFIPISKVNGNNMDGSIKNTTPGFEIVILLFSIFVLLKIKKKRSVL